MTQPADKPTPARRKHFAARHTLVRHSSLQAPAVRLVAAVVWYDEDEGLVRHVLLDVVALWHREELEYHKYLPGEQEALVESSRDAATCRELVNRGYALDFRQWRTSCLVLEPPDGDITTLEEYAEGPHCAARTFSCPWPPEAGKDEAALLAPVEAMKRDCELLWHARAARPPAP